MYDEMAKRYMTTFCNDGKELPNLTGRVVAKFTLNKVEKIKCYDIGFGVRYCVLNNDPRDYPLCEKSCLTQEELNAYLKEKDGYAWHIDNLVIFGKPKELKEFYQPFRCKKHEWKFADNNVEVDSRYKALRQPIRGGYEYTYPLTKAPQSWCYCEVEE
jgi:hypothetical protein